MPRYKGHLLGGCFAYLVVSLFCLWYRLPCLYGVEQFLWVMIGSLFPDIDTKSKGQKLFYSCCMLGMIYVVIHGNMAYQLSYIAPFLCTPLLVSHRGVFHRLWFIIAITVGFAYLFSLWYPSARQHIVWDATFFLIGAISHLYLDVGIRKMCRLSWK